MTRILIRLRRLEANLRLWQLARQVTIHAPRAKLSEALHQSDTNEPHPVIFFNASTRLTGLSQNAAFSLLTALGLQLAGVPVVNFSCRAGMIRCVLGAAYHGIENPPPCRSCIAQSRWLSANAPTIPFEYNPAPVLTAALQSLSIEALSSFEHALQTPPYPIMHIPLGQLVLPSLRWVLRRHTLPDDEPTRSLARAFISSAYQVSQEFDRLLELVQPRAVVLFNGQFFPEAAARWVAQRRGLRVISHEVGFQPFSAFFTDGEATAYPLDIPAGFDLNEEQNTRLDAYLSQRFQGQFSMAGIRFWPQMLGLGEAFQKRAAAYRQIVPVFTNVIFDTSQPHSNTIFPHMFVWLDRVLELACQNTDTLFVIRAHPDETRTGKESRESVADWVADRRATDLQNVIFISSREPLSSYELIQRSKFVMIYNSTIGLEAAILGAVVLSAGRARFTQVPTVFFPLSEDAYCQQAQDFLSAESITAPAEFRLNARRFLYYQLFRSSLPFGDFLEPDGIWPGFVRLKRFDWRLLTPERSLAIRAIIDGALHGGSFLLVEDSA